MMLVDTIRGEYIVFQCFELLNSKKTQINICARTREKKVKKALLHHLEKNHLFQLPNKTFRSFLHQDLHPDMSFT